MTLRTFAIVSAMALVSSQAGASSAVTHRHSSRAAVHVAHSHRYVAHYDGGYPIEAYPGEIIARATARAQDEPGVTSELAPDARQTATGGPVGGVPGFSGGH